jgi:hypothetical protein
LKNVGCAFSRVTWPVREVGWTNWQPAHGTTM